MALNHQIIQRTNMSQPKFPASFAIMNFSFVTSRHDFVIKLILKLFFVFTINIDDSY